MQDTEN